MYIADFLRQVLPFDLDLLPPDAYLVGGVVRDALLHRRRNYIDLDFVLPTGAIQTAKFIANKYGAGFVVLDAGREIARVVFPSATVDFARQEGGCLLDDLHRRDFCLNAIALNLYTKEIVDPLEGQKDLEKGIIRMVSPKNLEDDPLRILRAYRQASQLGFQITPDTRKTLQKLAPLLRQVAAERVKSELDYLLQCEAGFQWLQLAYEDNILSYWLKNTTPKSIINLSKIDQTLINLEETYHPFKNLSSEFLALAKLSCLTANNSDLAQEELIKLKCSKNEIKTVTTILKYLPALLDFNSNTTLREQYFFFLNVGDTFPLIALRAIASNPENKSTIYQLIERYFNQNDLVAHPQSLITGNDLINELNFKPSPLIKEILTEVQIAHLENKIHDKQEALIFAQKYCTKNL
ncbi:CCA tRNA nucleotidyltransferase [Cyanobacterium sp. IPPAS B-1200]|uniref:CCA tRNA nucleotidyltransferase n=1 Tax=Cyanobacterium sp. IPPAS B-1200 TaxID=1562720 RepID=UPI000852570B|nr:CCA tRNA nucleotidyltransferase [Cyanobacterium sp. IPPAS B-1200]OEJ77513.1 [cytidine(C)-cytidine(C)-adenosine (A)]-adding enzyme [Cyanobacterium sp. IPPAS B-1200]